MKISESEIKEFEKKNKEICKIVTPIKQNPEMIEATKKWADLKRRLAEVNEKLIALGKTISDSNKDAQAVLDGQKFDPAISRQEMAREKSALVPAIELQAQKIGEIQISLSRAGCEQLKDVAEKFARESLAALEAAATALSKQEIWLNYISLMGYKIGMRPANWLITPYEKNFLMSIDRHLNDRRIAWKFNSKGKKS